MVVSGMCWGSPCVKRRGPASNREMHRMPDTGRKQRQHRNTSYNRTVWGKLKVGCERSLAMSTQEGAWAVQTKERLTSETYFSTDLTQWPQTTASLHPLPQLVAIQGEDMWVWVVKVLQYLYFPLKLHWQNENTFKGRTDQSVLK